MSFQATCCPKVYHAKNLYLFMLFLTPPHFLLLQYQEFYVDGFDEFEGSGNKETFFTPAEASLLLYNCLSKVSFERVSIF